MNIYCTDSIKRGENMDLYSMSAAEAVKKLGSETDRGLSSREAEKRLDRDGENLLRGKKKKSLAAEFFEQFKDFTVIVLLIASGVSFATSFLEERGDFADPIMILIIVILNAAVGVIQQRRAEHSLEALKNMSAPTAAVNSTPHSGFGHLPMPCLEGGTSMMDKVLRANDSQSCQMMSMSGSRFNRGHAAQTLKHSSRDG